MTQRSVILLLATSLLVVAPDSFAQLDPAARPVPLRRAPLPAFVPSEEPPPALRVLPSSGPSTPPEWHRFKGATRCEQSGDGVVRCDNGYREETAR